MTAISLILNSVVSVETVDNNDKNSKFIGQIEIYVKGNDFTDCIVFLKYIR